MLWPFRGLNYDDAIIEASAARYTVMNAWMSRCQWLNGVIYWPGSRKLCEPLLVRSWHSFLFLAFFSVRFTGRVCDGCAYILLWWAFIFCYDGLEREIERSFSWTNLIVMARLELAQFWSDLIPIMVMIWSFLRSMGLGWPFDVIAQDWNWRVESSCATQNSRSGKVSHAVGFNQFQVPKEQQINAWVLKYRGDTIK